MVAIITGAIAIIVLAAALRREPVAPAPPVEASAPGIAPQPVTAAPPIEPPTPSPEALAAAALAEAQAAEARAATRRKVEPPPAPVPPPRDGTVTLAVSPWGEISVNGSPRGVSPPLTQLTLPPGLHTIEIRNGSAAPFVARVEIKSGETLGLQHRF